MPSATGDLSPSVRKAFYKPLREFAAATHPAFREMGWDDLAVAALAAML
jgi:hypothetical protein